MPEHRGTGHAVQLSRSSHRPAAASVMRRPLVIAQLAADREERRDDRARGRDRAGGGHELAATDPTCSSPQRDSRPAVPPTTIAAQTTGARTSPGISDPRSTRFWTATATSPAQAPAAVDERARTVLGRSPMAMAARPPRPSGTPHSISHWATTFSGCVNVQIPGLSPERRKRALERAAAGTEDRVGRDHPDRLPHELELRKVGLEELRARLLGAAEDQHERPGAPRPAPRAATCR